MVAPSCGVQLANQMGRPVKSGRPIPLLRGGLWSRPRCARRLFPVRSITIVSIDPGSPGGISHVRPVVLIETRSILQSFLVKVQDGVLFRQIEVQRVPRDGKILVAHPKKPSEG